MMTMTSVAFTPDAPPVCRPYPLRPAQSLPMPAPLGLLGATLALPHGFDAAGLAAMAAGQRPEQAMLRPTPLRGRVLQLDPASALAACCAAALRNGVLADFAAERVGIVLATRHGNAVVARQFADRVRRGSVGPALFAAAGYNAGTGLAAMAAGVNGPSTALAGRRAALAAALARTRQLILRGDADAMIAIVAESDVASGQALAAALAVSRLQPGLCSLSPERLQGHEADAVLLQATQAFPWLRQDAAAVLALGGVSP